MIKIKTLEVGYLQTNCYIITSDNYDGAVIIDAGGGYEKICDYLHLEGKRPTAVLLTHGHFDHIMAVSRMVKEGAKVYMHKADSHMLLGQDNLMKTMGIMITPVTAHHLVEDNEILQFGDITIKVIHTPGHTKGGVCYLIEEANAIFCGDTIFAISYGRTDFEGGSFTELKNSIINKIFTLEKDYTIYPGHDRTTTLFYEKKHNPILTD